MILDIALIRLPDAARFLGFDTTNKNWRVGFHRFLKRSRLPVVRLSTRRLRIRPEVLEAYVASREVGRMPKPVGFPTAGRKPSSAIC
jgi:hypothetical protein